MFRTVLIPPVISLCVCEQYNPQDKFNRHTEKFETAGIHDSTSRYSDNGTVCGHQIDMETGEKHDTISCAENTLTTC